ncbi:MAG: TIGR01777 family oxidoreductase, partial [Planctomycetes bacterium]|nr:TIGR01777 family oxidoreductase [Planctomycetota bacterium]
RLPATGVVLNLAGESVAAGRLGGRHFARVLSSRVDATRALVQAQRACADPPTVFLSASATGYYGDTGEADVTEDAPSAEDFPLAEVCRAWEAAAQTLNQPERRARVVLLRLGVVFARDAPAWTKLMGPVRMGVGGALGSGQQWWSWIHVDDLVAAILHLAADERAAGAFNLTSPHPVRQADLVSQAALLCGRPSFFPAPAFVLRLALGKVADALLLGSCRALPTRLQALGFTWRYGRIEEALVELIPASESA